jgi:hypothetical protein
MGLMAMAVTLVVAVVLVRAEVPLIWRSLVAVPAFFTAMGALSGLYRVCPMVAKDGMRETDRDGLVPMCNKEACRAAVSMGRRMTMQGLVFAATVTLGVLAV